MSARFAVLALVAFLVSCSGRGDCSCARPSPLHVVMKIGDGCCGSYLVPREKTLIVVRPP